MSNKVRSRKVVRPGSRLVQTGHRYDQVNVHGGNVVLGDYHEASNNTDVIVALVNSLYYPEMNARLNQITISHESTFEWAFGAAQTNYHSWATEGDEFSDSDPPMQDIESIQNVRRVSSRERSMFERSSQQVQQLTSFRENSPQGARFGSASPEVDRSHVGLNLHDWLQDEVPICWISGKPGSGKSTFMKFLLRHETTRKLLRRRSKARSENVLCHFFWLAGSEVQSSLQGCWASLLHQLIVTDGALHKHCLEWVDTRQERGPQPMVPDAKTRQRYRQKFISQKRSFEDWDFPEIDDLLSKLLAVVEVPTCIFIDGLDEFDRTQNPRLLLNRIDKLSQFVNVKVCVSSRPEMPLHNVLSRHPWLRLQDLTFDDMYVLAQDRLGIEIREAGIVPQSHDHATQLAQRVAERAEGVFLWAILAIKRLLKDVWTVDDLDVLLSRLDKLPKEMSALYNEMLSRLDHEDDFNWTEMSRFCLFWPHSPLILATLALAANATSGGDIWKNCNGSLFGLVEQSEITRRRLQSQSAGLLMVEPWQDIHPAQTRQLTVPISVTGNMKAISVLCSCYTSILDTQQWHFVEACLDAEVRPIHRTVMDFFRSGEFDRFNLDDNEKCIAIRDFILARTATECISEACLSEGHDNHERKILRGLHPDSDQQHKLIQRLHHALLWLQNMLSDLCLQTDPLNVKSSLMIIHTAWPQSSTRHEDHCPCNWYSLLLSHSHPFGDLLGLYATFGQNLIPSLREVKVAEPTAYYKGYLLICAARGRLRIALDDEPHLLNRARFAIWLCEQEADLLTHQLVCIREELRLFQHRSPYIECLLLIVRLLIATTEQKDARTNAALRLIDIAKHFPDGILEEDIDFALYIEAGKILLFDATPSSDAIYARLTVSNWFSLQISTSLFRNYVFQMVDFATSKTDQTFPALATFGCRVTSSLRSVKLLFDPNNDIKFLEHVDAMLQEQVTFGRCFEAMCSSSWKAAWDETEYLAGFRRDNVQMPGCMWTLPDCPHRPFCLGILHGTNIERLKLVAPEYSHEITERDWYEKGALRAWHEQREQGLVTVPWCVLEWERRNNLLPSYITETLDEHQRARPRDAENQHPVLSPTDPQELTSSWLDELD